MTDELQDLRTQVEALRRKMNSRLEGVEYGTEYESVADILDEIDRLDACLAKQCGYFIACFAACTDGDNRLRSACGRREETCRVTACSRSQKLHMRYLNTRERWGLDTPFVNL